MPVRSDSDIKRGVEEELRREPDIDAADIGVAVKDGAVTLVGTVGSYPKKLAAEVAAKRVAGIAGIANDLEVGNRQRSDPDIAREAISAIRARTRVPDTQIRATVKDGWVTLEGEADRLCQPDAAHDAVRGLPGVKGVVNLIALRPPPPPSEIKHRIEEAFRRGAQLDAARISVEAKDGEVILKGTLRSWAKRQDAERAAWTTPGVSKVDNRIVIDLFEGSDRGSGRVGQGCAGTPGTTGEARWRKPKCG